MFEKSKKSLKSVNVVLPLTTVEKKVNNFKLVEKSVPLKDYFLKN